MIRVIACSRVFFAARIVAVIVLAAKGFAAAAPSRVPFSGGLGGTTGAGSLTGWERLGGQNPAVLGAGGFSAAAAGYVPFGLEGLRVMELEGARDASRWGISGGGRFLFDTHGPDAARWIARLAWRRAAWSAGTSLQAVTTDGSLDPGAGLGVLWRPRPFLSLGAAGEAERADGAWETRGGLGIDGGTGLWAGSAWRLCAERAFGPEREWRYGFRLRLHQLLSVQAGLSPARQTAALGITFGAGGWEGASALRRHSALGGTSVQGLKWIRGRKE